MSELNNPNVSVENPNSINQGQAVPSQAPQGNMVTELVYTRTARQQVREMASWTKFIAIFQLVCMILYTGFIGYTAFTIGSASYVLLGIIILIDLIWLIPTIRLIKFSSKAKLGLRKNDSKEMELAMKSMNGFWRFTAVLLMLGIIIFMFSIFISGANFLSAMFSGM